MKTWTYFWQIKKRSYHSCHCRGIKDLESITGIHKQQQIRSIAVHSTDALDYNIKVERKFTKSMKRKDFRTRNFRKNRCRA